MKKRIFLTLFGGLMLTALFSFALNSDIVTWKGIQTVREVDAVTVDSDGDITSYHGDINLGQSGSTPSTTANTYPGFTVPIFNASGASIPVGSVIVASTTNNVTAGWGTIVGELSTTTVLGVAYETIAAGAVGDMTIAGWALILTTGAVHMGDILVSTSVVGTSILGRAGVDNTPTSGAVIGVAMSVGAASGDTVLVKLR